MPESVSLESEQKAADGSLVTGLPLESDDEVLVTGPGEGAVHMEVRQIRAAAHAKVLTDASSSFYPYYYGTSNTRRKRSKELGTLPRR